MAAAGAIRRAMNAIVSPRSLDTQSPVVGDVKNSTSATGDSLPTDL